MIACLWLQAEPKQLLSADFAPPVSINVGRASVAAMYIIPVRNVSSDSGLTAWDRGDVRQQQALRTGCCVFPHLQLALALHVGRICKMSILGLGLALTQSGHGVQGLLVPAMVDFYMALTTAEVSLPTLRV